MSLREKIVKSISIDCFCFQVLGTDESGTLTDFEAVPGFGLKCIVSNIEDICKKTNSLEENDVTHYVEGILLLTEISKSFLSKANPDFRRKQSWF